MIYAINPGGQHTARISVTPGRPRVRLRDHRCRRARHVAADLAHAWGHCPDGVPARPVGAGVSHRHAAPHRQSLRPRAAGPGAADDVVTHRQALPHKDVAAAIKAVRDGSAQPAVNLPARTLNASRRNCESEPRQRSVRPHCRSPARTAFASMMIVNVVDSPLLRGWHDCSLPVPGRPNARRQRGA